MLANDAERPSEEHRGYEILYVAGQRSWHYRADPDGPLSQHSYRSAFQARRAVDHQPGVALLDRVRDAGTTVVDRCAATGDDPINSLELHMAWRRDNANPALEPMRLLCAQTAAT